MLANSVVLKMKAPTDIASCRGSRNLVMLRRDTRQETFYHRINLPSKPLSLNPDLFMNGSEARKSGCSSRHLGSFRPPTTLDRRIGASQKAEVISRETGIAGVYVQSLSFTKEVWGQRQINVERVSINRGLVSASYHTSQRKPLRATFNADSSGRCSEYRGDNVPHSLYQPHSGSNPAGSCGQKVSSRALITALQASIGSELGGTL